MATDISTTLTELPESRVRVDAEVGPAEVERRVTQAAKLLARNIRVPGFRAGKAPPPVVIKRVGREAVVDEAVRESLGVWYRAAIDDARVVPVGEPDVDLSELPKEGESLKFSIEIGVRPKAELGEYKGLEVEKREPGVQDSVIEEELEKLRERAAKLDTVDRQAQRGDFVVMDFAGSVDGVPFAGGEGRDQMIELGSGRLVPGFEEQREGALDAAVDAATVEVPDALVEARAREMWDSMLHSLSHQGIDRETYLRLSGTTEDETIEKAKPDADVALRREAVLAAIAEAESLDPSEEEMLEAVTEVSGQERVKPEKLLERLRKNGRLDSLKDDLSQRKAWDLVADSAKPVPATASDS